MRDRFQLPPSASLVLAALQVTVVAAAEVPWPAEALSAATNLTAVEGPGTNDFHVNMSSAFWNPQTRRLWVCRNGGTGGSKFWALREDGNGSFEIDYQNGLRGEWTNFGDLEAVTQAHYGEAAIYLLLEGEERIKEYSIATYGTAVLVNNWNTSPHLPLNGGSGAEGLCFVPDSFLAAQGFVDGSGNPYLSQNGMGGLMFVAHQNGGRLYAFDLNRSNGTFTFVGAYKTNYGESCELAFDRSDGRLYILHGADWNRIEVTTLGSTQVSGERKLNEILTYGRPAGSPSSWNLEGFAIMSNTDCNSDQRSVFLTIDDGGANSLLWYKQFPCTCGSGDDDGDGVLNCTDTCPGTAASQPVDTNGCSCSQNGQQAPAISTHPAPVTACVGSSAQFCVTATGTPPLSYQWRRNGVDISGATASCYSATLAGAYTCTVTNNCGSVLSNSASLSHNAVPSVTGHPSAATICNGQTNQFCVTATGSGTLTYQWQKDGANVSGASSSCYTASSAGSYRCVVTNSCGSATSNAAGLTVNDVPTVATQPVAATICSGQSNQFCVVASGVGPFTYQWQKNGVNIVGATSSCYSATVAGSYRCIILNACGSRASNSVALTVNTGVAVTSHPTSGSVCTGQTRQFCITATGGGTLTYQWQKDGADVAGATASCYDAGLAGSYRCVVSNGCSSATSNSATLTVNVAPAITSHPISGSVCSGNSLQFCVVATGATPLSYQWQKDNVNIGGATSSCYSTSTQGAYRCVVTNACGSATSNAALLTLQFSMTWYRDADNDGFGNPLDFQLGCSQPAGYVSNNLDCNDASAAYNPNAVDVCGQDRNCDGIAPSAALWYRDFDGDGFGNPLNLISSCTQPAGFVSNFLDCDDGQAAVNPNAVEVCDGIDNDCNGLIDELGDSDGDGVLDCLDACPGTLTGAAVDANGCSCQQLTPGDSDNDGIGDCVDLCPNTPAGNAVDNTGCACAQIVPIVDLDRDRVPDCADACPNTPLGSVVNESGCSCLQINPNADADSDGVPDCLDQCPGSLLGSTVNEFGCPFADSPVNPERVGPGTDSGVRSTDPLIGSGACGAGSSATATLGLVPLMAFGYRRRRPGRMVRKTR